MPDTKTLTLDQLLDGIGQRLDTVLARRLESWQPSLPGPDPQPSPGPSVQAAMGQALSPADGSAAEEQYMAQMGLRQLTGPVERPLNGLLPNFQLGSVVIGGATGLIAGELVDGIVAPGQPGASISWGNLALKGATALGLAYYGKNIMSQRAAQFAAGVLVLQMVADVVPLDQWIQQFKDWLKKTFGKAEQSALRQAEAVAQRAWEAHSAQLGPRPSINDDIFR